MNTLMFHNAVSVVIEDKHLKRNGMKYTEILVRDSKGHRIDIVIFHDKNGCLVDK